MASASSSKRELTRLADQLHRAIHGEAWHGPSWAEIAAEGQESPRILSLTLHTAVWLDVVRERLSGPVEVDDARNFPPVDGVSWAEAWGRLKESAGALEHAILALGSDDELDAEVPGKPGRSLYVELHGAVQHAVYHAGQVMLLIRLGDDGSGQAR